MPRRSGPLKVYGWRSWRTECPRAPNGNQQTREIMAARSWSEVARTTGLGYSYLRNNGSETGNAEEVAVATAKPGTVFWTPLSSHQVMWIEVTPGKDEP